MIESLTKPLLEFLKLAPRYLVALCLVAAFLLFSPKNVLEYLAVHDFTENYRQRIGLFFIVSSALLDVSVAGMAGRRIRDWWNRRKFHLEIIKSLNLLTEDEKQILRFYIAKQTKTNTLRFDDGVVNGLVAKGIIYRAATVGNLLEGSAHNISEIAWDHLNIHPHLLDGTTNTYRTDKRINWFK